MYRYPLLCALVALLAVAPARAQGFPFAVGAAGDQEALSVAAAPDGSSYVVGTFANAPDFDPGAGTTTLTSAGAFDIFVAHYDFDGALLWAFNIGGLNNDAVDDVAVTSDGGIALAGRFNDTIDADPGGGTATLTSIGGNDVLVAKFTADGALAWAFGVGGPEDDRGLGLAATDDGGVVVAGAYAGIADFDPGSGLALLTPVAGEDVFVARYDGDGNYDWAIGVGGSSNDLALAAALTGDGDVVVAGTFEGTVDFDPGSGTANATAAATNGFVASYDGDDGAFRWVRPLTSDDDNRAFDVATSGDGGVYVTGEIRAETSFGGGTTLTPSALFDAFLARYDDGGSLQWAFGLMGESTGLGVDVAANGDVVFTGRFNGDGGSNDFDPGPDVVTLTANGGTDIFAARYESDNTFAWASYATGPDGNSFEQGNAVALDGFGNAVVVGFFNTEEAGQSVTFHYAGGAMATVSSSGENDLFVVKYDPAGGPDPVAGEPAASGNVPVLSAPSPNPAVGATHFSLTLPRPQHVRVDVFDGLGRRVATLHDGVLTAGETAFTLDAAALPSGVYVVRAAGDDFAEAVRATVVR
jgi:hypothetical protein